MNKVTLLVLAALLLLFGAAAVVTSTGDDRPSALLITGGGPANPTTKVATISTGERVNLAAHAIPNGLTIFDFTADW